MTGAAAGLRRLFRDRARATLGVGGGAHFLHDGFSDALYVLLPLWSQAFGLSIAQAGVLKAVYSGAQAAFQLPAGFLAERRGERILLATGTVATGLAFVALGRADGFWALVAILAVAGLASGVQHPLSSSLVAAAFENGPRRAALGIYNFTGDLGKVAVPALIALVAGAVGWRIAVAGYGMFGIVAGLAIFVALGRLAVGRGTARRGAETRTGWGIHNRSGFAALSAIGMIDSATRYGFLTLLPFLLVANGAGVERIGLALALVFAGGAAGKLVCGLAAERLGVIRTAVATELVTGAGIVAVAYLPAAAVLVVLPVVGVALHGTSSVLYGTVAEFVERERTARAFGLFYTLGVGAGALSPAAFGLLGDMAGVSSALAVIGAVALATLPLCGALAVAMPPAGAGGGTV